MGGSSERIVSLQILRFVAAMMVALCHARYLTPTVFGSVGPHWFWNGAVMGVAGVDIFFVVSGFVIAMTGPLAQPRPSGALFFWRRWRRVAPVFFVISLPFIVNAARAGPLSADQLIATFLFLPVAGREVVTPYVGVGWTLCYEMAFYSAVALVLAGGRLRRNLAIAGGVVAALVAWRVLSDAVWLRWLVNPMFLEFGAGVALAALRGRLARLGPAFGLALLAIGVGAFAAEFVIGMGDAIGNPWTVMRGGDLWPRLLFYGVPASFIVAAAPGCERWARGAIGRVLATGGDASYALYLVHSVAMAQVATLWTVLRLPDWPFVLVTCGLLAAIAAGLLVWRVIERPILRDLKRLNLRRQPQRRVVVGGTAAATATEAGD